MLHVLLGVFIFESATNKSLASMKSVFWILYGLDIIIKNERKMKCRRTTLL